MCRDACLNDDLEAFKQAVAEAPGHQSRFPAQDLLAGSLDLCLRHRLPKILTALLDDYGVDVAKASPRIIGAGDDGDDLGNRGPPYAILDILIAHGWDINTRGSDSLNIPLLWRATSNAEFVDWCLSHGASVNILGETPIRDARGVGPVERETVLESTARDGSPETFEKLRARGAPTGQRTLHKAVLQAIHTALKPGERDHVAFDERLDMVRHLVSEVKLDPNAYCGMVGMPAGSPLYTVATYPNGRDTRRLIWLLLDRGADPDLPGPTVENESITPSPMVAAEREGNKVFLEAVKEWRARQSASEK